MIKHRRLFPLINLLEKRIAAGILICTACTLVEVHKKYQLLTSELDRLGFASQHITVEIGFLGHYLPESIRALQATIQQSTAVCRSILDKAARIAIKSSQRIFLTRDCVDWNVWLACLGLACVCFVLSCLYFYTFLAMPILCTFRFFLHLCSRMCPRWLVTVCVFHLNGFSLAFKFNFCLKTR